MADKPTPTPGELEILKVLWEHGPASVRDVADRLRQIKNKSVAFNTVQTLLRLMESKGLAEHQSLGRTFIYSACYSRDESTARFLDRVFDGAAAQLVQSLLRTEQITDEELDRIRVMIDSARGKEAN